MSEGHGKREGRITWGRVYGQSGDHPLHERAPQGKGTGRYTPNTGDASDGGEWDQYAIQCAICGYHIADYRKPTACPLCEYDNFLPFDGDT